MFDPEYTIESGGRARDYLLHIPKDFSDSLVLVLHGGGGNGEFVRWQSKMNATSDEHKFLCCYPSALTYWETGAPPKWPRKVDDVAFLKAVVEHIEVTYPVNHVFLAGISNGAHMALRLASEWERVKAVATIAAIRSPGQYMPAPTHKFALIHFHGSRDALQPYLGGRVGDSYFKPYTIPDSETAADAWAKWNAGQHVVGVRSAYSDPIVTDWNCAPAVRYCHLLNHGHAWPGGRISEAELRAGCGPVQDYPANERIWSFFKEAIAGA